MVMPQVTGEELFYELREKHPSLPIVLMSGFTREANITAMKEKGLAAFLRKPFTRVELSFAVSQHRLHGKKE